MTALRRDPGGFQSGRPAANDRHMARLVCRSELDLGFPTGQRVEHAVRTSTLAELRQAALMASGAQQDRFLVPSLRLAYPIRVGQQRTSQADQIG